MIKPPFRRTKESTRLIFELLEDRRLLAVQDLSSFPAEFTRLGSDVLFSAQNAIGYELWKYNGATVSQVADINPTGSSLPSELTVVGNQLYFVASDGTPTGDPEFTIWKYDGSVASKVLDTTGLAPLEPANLTAVGTTLFFVAEDATNGRELWKTNGTAAGTVMMKDISPADSPFDGPDELINVGGTLYFIAFDSDNGWELWKSDGTELGTEIVADINPGAEGSLPQELTAVGSSLFFRADDGTNGEELWVVSGANPPDLVKDINTSGPANPRDLTAVGTKLFFATQDEATDSLLIWASDGTEVGTQVAATLHVGDGWDAGALVEVDGDLYFSAVATDERDGWELWKIDGTTLVSTPLATFADWGQWLDPSTLMESGDRLYFASFDATYGHEVWTSDGTVTGTKRLTDINLQVGNASPQFLTDIDGVLYFAADNSVIGFEPYSYDRTGLGLRLISNIAAPKSTPEVHISLAFDSDSGYENNDAITRNTTPTFVVDVNMPGQVQIDYNDDNVFEFSQAVSNWGTYKFAPSTALANGERTITVRFTANAMMAEDDTVVTVDTVGPSLLAGYPVSDTSSDFYALFFNEPINEDRIFVGDFLLSGPGIITPISLNEFFIDPAANRIDVGFAPLTTPGIYTISVNNGLEDRAGNLLNPASPASVSFEVLANAVYLDQPSQTYVWDSAYEGKDLVIDSATLEVSGTHNLSSLWLLNGAQIVPVTGQALELIVASKVVIDETSAILADGLGQTGGALITIGAGLGGGAAGTDGGGGGGHGGAGGNGGSTANAAGGIANGSDTMPIDLGSGGGGSATSTGGAGGGAVKLGVGGTLILDGTISAAGSVGTGTDAAGGAGGSIWIIADSIEGDGLIKAVGANALGFGGAGGGGRVAVSVTGNSFTGSVSVAGGVGTLAARNGAAGTIVANPAFPGAGAGSEAPAGGSEARLPGERVYTKNPVNYQVKNNPSDKGSDAVRKNHIARNNKKNSITIKNLPSGSYQVRYTDTVARTRSLPVSLAKTFGTATRTGVQRTLSFAVSTQPQFTPTMTWDGGGDGVNWTSALNWSTDTLPTAGDTVYIPAGISSSVTLTGTRTVRALFSAANFVLSGSLTISELSELTGTFTMTAGASLTSVGPQARFTANGISVVDGGNLFAANGGQISLPGVVNFAASTSGSTFRASGVGSVLSLPNLPSVVAPANASMQVEAFDGGRISLPVVVRIGDSSAGSSGSYYYNTHTITADGPGSRIELPVLTQIVDRDNALSSITPRNGGVIQAPLLTSLQGANLVLDGTGTVPIAQLTDVTAGRLTLSGVNVSGDEYVFANLNNIANTTVDVHAVDVDLDAVTSADGASLLVDGGVMLTLPGVVNFAASTSGSTFRASGVGSVLSLPNLPSVVAPANASMRVEAFDGGRISLPIVVRIGDSSAGSSGSYYYNTHTITADGPGSRIELPVLTQIVDRDNALSSITPRNGGVIQAPLLTSLQGANLVLDGTGTVPIAQLTDVTAGRLTLSGVNVSGDEYVFANLNNIANTTVDVHAVDVDLDAVTSADGASLLVDGGVMLTLPGVVNFAASTSGSTFRASGVGSVLSLPNLPSVVAPANASMRVEAFDGGRISLPIVVRIGDSSAGSSGSYYYNTHTITADGPGSRIELPVLTQIVDRDNALSSMTASNSGTIVLSSTADTSTQRVTVALTNNGTIAGSLALTTAGSLLGAGTITGNVISALTINPAGTITIGGNYTQTQSGILAIDISGHQPTDVDKLVIGGTANFNGQLQVTRTNGTIPIPGDNYPILTFTSSQNDFSLKTGLDLGNLRILKPVFGANALTLVTTTTPGVGVFVDSGQTIGPTSGNASQGREVRLGDVNNDGDLDALVSSDGSASTNPLWVNNGAGVFTNGSGFPTTTVGPALALADIDNDNDLDVIAGFGASQPLRIYRNQGGLQGGSLGNFTFVTGSTLGTGDIRGVALADLDGDGDRDAFLAITGGGNQVWINQGGAQLGTLGAFLNSGQSLGSLNSVDVVLADLDGDNDIDAATAASTTNTVIWRNNGAGTFTQLLSISNGGTFVTFGDIDGDTDLDIITANGAGTGGRIIRNTGGGTFNSATVFSGGSALDMALGDIDSDGDIDVYAANGSSQPNKVWFNNGTGTFNDSLQALGNTTSQDVAFGDLDLDGDLDAFVADDGPDKVWLNQSSVDYGDAPDATYPTLAASSGAGHNIVPGYYLGTGVDAEANGQPHPFALGDDITGIDDDNGVVFSDTLFVGVANGVNVTASAPGILDGWIDFNSDGDWDDVGEKVLNSVPLVAGVNSLNFVVPPSATATIATFARFRFSSTGGLTPRGMAINGEVEDYFVPIRELDMGDAAAGSFPTLLADNGPRHMLVDGYYLGSGVSAESDGQPSAFGVGDNADDGVQFVTPLAPGKVATVKVSASAPGLVDGWIDVDGDGQVDVGEHILVSILVNAGDNLIPFNVPANANIGDVVFSRFRFSSVGGLGIGGFAPNGEVEDYAVTITNGLSGDYSSDAAVGAGDYVLWRKQSGTSGVSYITGDGSGNGHVGPEDYDVWRANFGATLSPGTGSEADAAIISADGAMAVTGSIEVVEIGSDLATQAIRVDAELPKADGAIVDVTDQESQRTTKAGAVDLAFANYGKRSASTHRFLPSARREVLFGGVAKLRDLVLLHSVFDDPAESAAYSDAFRDRHDENLAEDDIEIPFDVGELFAAF